MVVDTINKLIIFVMLGFLVFGFFRVIEEAPEKEKLFETLTNEPVNASRDLFLFWYGYSGITPAYVNDWLPASINPKGEHVFLLEDIPLPDSTDLFVIIPLVLSTIFILKHIPYFRKGWGVLWAILIVFVIILGGWVALKYVHYQLMYQGAEALHINPELVLEERAKLNTNVKDYVPTMIILFLFSGVAVAKLFSSFYLKKKKSR